jgi:predicted ATPase
LTLARELAHPFSLAYALFFAAVLHQFRREWHLAQERADAGLALGTEQGFALFVAGATTLRGWACAWRSPAPSAGQAQVEEGIAQMQQGLAAWRATVAKALQPYVLALLAEAYTKVGQHETGLTLLAEALAVTNDTGEHRWEAELYRLQGELLLAYSVEHEAEAETCLRQALDIARRQEAKYVGAAGRHEPRTPVAAPGQVR